MKTEFKRMQELAGLKLQENLNENQSPEMESFLKSKGLKVEKVKGSTDGIERGEKEFVGAMELDSNPAAAEKNKKAFISTDVLVDNGVKSFMVFIPKAGNESLKSELIKKFGGESSGGGGALVTPLIIPIEKKSLNEHQIGGIVGVGAINNPFEGRKKESYEDAFEHFLGEKYALKEEEEKEVKEGEEVELKENAGTSIDNFINSFDFSQKGNDELIDFAHRLLNRNVSSGEFEKLKSYFGNDLEFFNFVSDPSKGVKAIAQQIYQKLKQGVGNTGKIETWATDPMALQSLLDKLK